MTEDLRQVIPERERERERESTEAELAIEDTNTSFLSFILGILGSIALIFIAINYAPMLEQNELISTQHMDYNGFDVSYVFWVQVVFITSAVLCIIRYTLNFLFNLKSNLPALASGLQILNLAVALGIWLAMYVFLINGFFQQMGKFSNDFNWWFLTIMMVILFGLCVIFGIFVAGRVLPLVPDFLKVCICLAISVGAIFIFLAGMALIVIAFLLVIIPPLLRLVLGFMGSA